MTDSGSETKIAGTPLNVMEIGSSGEPMIVMHGWGQSLDSMRLLGGLLGKFYHLYLIDLPGFGKSPGPPSDWDTVEYAQRIALYMDEKGIAPAHVLGHSFGGRVAIRLASRYPSYIRSVVLINSGGLKRTLVGKRWLRAKYTGWLGRRLKESDRLLGTKLYESWFVPRYASADYKNAGPLKNILVKAVTEDVSDDASKIQAPALLIWGELDDETPVEIGGRLNRLIGGSKLVVMPGKDHFPFVDEGAHLCASYILKFLSSLKAESARTSAETTKTGRSEKESET